MRRYVKEIRLPNDAKHIHEENDHQTYCPVIHILLDGFQVPAGSSSMIGDLMCTGLTTWRVADLTAAFIASHHKDFSRKHVLELGCGLGLCGILAGTIYWILI